MTKPLTNRAQVDPGFQQMNRRTMPHTVRMQSFALSCGHRCLSLLQIFVQNVANPEAGQRLPALIDEQRTRSLRVKLALGTQLAQQGGRLGHSGQNRSLRPLPKSRT